MKKILVFILYLLFIQNSFANQQYEKLSYSTKIIMSETINDRLNNNLLNLSSFSNKEEEIIWINNKDKILSKYIKDKEYRKIFLKTLHYEATRSAIEPELLLGLITVESAFRKHAISSAGAVGYTQVMPFWLDLLGKNKNHNLFDLHVNLRYGTTILRHYIEIEKGNVFRALARYNGSLGKNTYPNLVLEKRKIWLN